MACPDLIKCCGLYPNTPLVASTGQCAVSQLDAFVGGIYDVCDPLTGDYSAGRLCNENILDSVSYLEFAGVRIYIPIDIHYTLYGIYISAGGVGVFIIYIICDQRS
jgi:hypothetical protein